MSRPTPPQKDIKIPPRINKFSEYALLILFLKTFCGEYTAEYGHVLMRDEKEGRMKQTRSNKQQGKATQHTHCSHFS